MSNTIITAITELEGDNYQTKIFAGGHFVMADEPEDLGGTDQGMTPGALLLGSLGSCTAITIKMYAKRKAIALNSVKIYLEICDEVDMDKGTTISRKIELSGDFTAEQRKRMMVLADKCPIHNILSNPIKIVTD